MSGTTYPVATRGYSDEVRFEFSVTWSFDKTEYHTLHFPTVQEATEHYFGIDARYRVMHVHISGDVTGIPVQDRPIRYNNSVQVILMRDCDGDSAVVDASNGIIHSDVFGDLGGLHQLHHRIVIDAAEYINTALEKLYRLMQTEAYEMSGD